jgi:hypothetical protein
MYIVRCYEFHSVGSCCLPPRGHHTTDDDVAAVALGKYCFDGSNRTKTASDKDILKTIDGDDDGQARQTVRQTG